MGCDIHDFCEVQQEDGSWEMLGEVFDNPYYRENEEKDEWNRPKTEHPYRMRNYSLFGFLAGVRGEEIPALVEPRGIPVDASEGYKQIRDRYGCDGHTPSYYTLKELLDYPSYHIPRKRDGYVSLNEYKRLKEEGQPQSWCGGVGGGNVVHLTNASMDKLITDPNYIKENVKELFYLLKSDNKRYPMVLGNIAEMERLYETDGKIPDFHFYTYVTWEEKASDCLGEWWFKTLDQMKAVAPNGDYSKVRYVFFFDN